MSGEVEHETAIAERVVLALASSDRAHSLAVALRASGFDVGTEPCITCAADGMPGDEPFVVIVDDSSLEWLGQVAELVRVRPSARPLALVNVETPAGVLTVLSFGIAGFVSPRADVEAIVRTARAMLDSGVAIPRGMVRALVEKVRHGGGRTVHTAAGRIDVTAREWEILQMLLQRRTTLEMAKALYVSEGTVRSHVSTVLKKLGAVDRDHAIRLVESELR